MMTREQLWKLRQEVCLGSLFVDDYRNSFGLTAKSVCDFFDGYIEFLWDIAQDDHGRQTTFEDVYALDSDEYLYEWYLCFDEDPFVKEAAE